MPRSHGVRVESPCDLACAACERGPRGKTLAEALGEIQSDERAGESELRILGCDPLSLAGLPELCRAARARGYRRILVETNGAGLGTASLEDVDELIVPELATDADLADTLMGRAGAHARLRAGLARWQGPVRLRVPVLAPGTQDPARAFAEHSRVAAVEPYRVRGPVDPVRARHVGSPSAGAFDESLARLFAAASALGIPCRALPQSGVELPAAAARRREPAPKQRFRVVLANLVERSFGYGPGAAEYLRAALLTTPDLAERIEVEVELIEGASTAESVERLLSLEPDLLGMSAYSWNLEENAQVCRQLRARGARFPIVWGGPSFALFARDSSWFSAWDAVDAVAIGSGEQSIVELTRHVLARGRLEQPLPGLALEQSGGVIIGGPAVEPSDLDEVASPFALGVAYRVEHPTVEMARGCVFDCSFCSDARSSRGGGLREHSEARIASDIAAVTTWSEARYLDAGASTANVTDAFFARVCRAIRAGDPGQRLSYGFQLYPSLASEAQRAALEGIRVAALHLGVQSLTRATFQPMRRGSRVAFVERALATFRGVGPLELSLILGLPGETYESFVAMFESLLAYSEARLVVNRLLVLPGTAYHLRRRELGLELDAGRYFRVLSTPAMSRADLARAQSHVIERALSLPDLFAGEEARVRWVNFDVQARFGDSPDYRQKRPA